MEMNPEDGHTPSLGLENFTVVEEELLAMRALFQRFSREQRNDDDTIGQLTTWQTATFRAIGSFINRHTAETPGGRCDITCGGGKTAIAIYTANALGAGRQRQDGSKRQLLLCTSRNGIIRQLTGMNFHYDDPEELISDFHYFAPNLMVSVYNRSSKNIDGDVVIMPYASVPRALQKGDLYPGRFSGFLLDEAHNIGPSVRNSLQICAGGMPMIGFDATPGNAKQFLPEVIDEVPMIDGIMKHKFLSNTRLLGIESGQIVRRSNLHAHNFQPADIAPLAVNDLRNKKIVETARFGVAKLGPGWIRCHPRYQDFDHTEAVAELINNSGPIIDQFGDRRSIRIEPVGRARKNSQDIIDEFITTDDIDGLAYVKLIGEGYNIPKFRWGLWIPPTLSYDILEQALGRGNRLDKHDSSKLFTLYQMIDVTPHERDKLAFAWEIFGVDRDSRDVITITHTGISGKPISETRPGDIEIPDFLLHSAKRPRPTPLHALDIAPTPLEKDKIVHALDTLCSATMLDRTWARRILFHGSFGASVILDENDMFEFFYEEDALPFLLDSVARPEDLPLPDAAMALGISERNMRALVDDYGYDLAYLYPREPSAWPIPRLHVRADIIERLRIDRGIRRELLDTEIAAPEIAERTGLAPRILGPYLENRGFTVKRVRIKGRATPSVVGNRSEIEPWIQAYIRAPDAPKEGFKRLMSYCRQQKDGTKATLLEAIKAAQKTGIKIWLFKHSSGERNEYVQATHHYRLKEELRQIVKHRYVQEVRNLPEQSYTNPIRKTLRTNPDVIAYHAQKLGIEFDSATLADTDELELLKKAILRAQRDLAIFYDEPNIIEAITGKPRDLDFPPPQKVSKHWPPDTATTRKRTVEFSDLRRCEFPSRLLQLVCERHSVLSAAAKQKGGTEKIIIDNTLYESLQEILRRSNIHAGAIPVEWQYVGDIAQQLHMQERDLMRFLVSKNFADTHFRYVELVGVRGIFAFCSPQLSGQLLRATEGQ